jgi:hypothetical protein
MNISLKPGAVRALQLLFFLGLFFMRVARKTFI